MELFLALRWFRSFPFAVYAITHGRLDEQLHFACRQLHSAAPIPLRRLRFIGLLHWLVSCFVTAFAPDSRLRILCILHLSSSTTAA